nr:gE [Suid alphaherpesvirus 1]WMT11021.1 gE [Suid alphaherpesvirus 1]WMT11023.1 gE [Suid alphaherpesvirus 1]
MRPFLLRAAQLLALLALALSTEAPSLSAETTPGPVTEVPSPSAEVWDDLSTEADDDDLNGDLDGDDRRAGFGSALASLREAPPAHLVNVSEGANFTLDARGDGAVLAGIWTFLPVRGCDAVSVTTVCFETACHPDLVLGRACVPEAPEMGIGDYLPPEVPRLRREPPIVTPERWSPHLSVLRATPNDTGLYTLHDASGPRAVFFVAVGDRPPAPADPVGPARHEPRFHALGFHSQLFSPGDTFDLMPRVVSDMGDSRENFTATLDWYYARAPPRCLLYYVYEPCIYHPRAPECLRPVDPACSFTSPARARLVARRAYASCSPLLGDRWLTACPFDAFGEEVHTNATADESGLYVLVMTHNGHVATWDYTLVATAAEYVTVIKELTAPARAPGTPWGPGGGDDAIYVDGVTTPAPPARPWNPYGRTTPGRLFVLALGSFVMTCVVGGAIWLCVLCSRRRAASRPFRVPTRARTHMLSPVYTSLPTHEDYYDGDDDDDEEAGVIRRRPASPGGDSGYEGSYASLDPEDEFSSDEDDGLYVRPEEAPRSGFDVWFRDPEKPEVTNGPNYGVTANRLLMSRPA